LTANIHHKGDQGSETPKEQEKEDQKKKKGGWKKRKYQGKRRSETNALFVKVLGWGSWGGEKG